MNLQPWQARLHTPDLTPAQSRYLREIQEAGERSYNGRARRPLEALRAAGLIEYDFELVPVNRYGFAERFTCRPLNPGQAARATDPGYYVPCGQTDPA